MSRLLRSSVALLGLGLIAACDPLNMGITLGPDGIGFGPKAPSGTVGVPAATGPAIAVASTWDEPFPGHADPLPGAPWRGGRETAVLAAAVAPKALAYAPDGQTLYVGGNDGRVVAWDVAKGASRWGAQALASLAEVDGLVASPRGDVVAAYQTNSGAVHLLDAATGAEQRKLDVMSYAPTCKTRRLVPVKVAFDAAGNPYGLLANELTATQLQPDGTSCRPLEDRTIVRWDATTGLVAWHHTLKVPPCAGSLGGACGWATKALAISPTTNVLAGAGCDGSVFTLDRDTGRETGRTPCPLDADARLFQKFPDLASEHAATSLAFTGDGQRVFASFGGAALASHHLATIGVAADGRATAPLFMTNGAPVAGLPLDLVSSPDGRYLARVNANAYVFAVGTGKLVFQAEAPGGQFAFNPKADEVVTLGHAGFARFTAK